LPEKAIAITRREAKWTRKHPEILEAFLAGPNTFAKVIFLQLKLFANVWPILNGDVSYFIGEELASKHFFLII
jgi:hypothetical protein